MAAKARQAAETRVRPINRLSVGSCVTPSRHVTGLRSGNIRPAAASLSARRVGWLCTSGTSGARFSSRVCACSQLCACTPDIHVSAPSLPPPDSRFHFGLRSSWLTAASHRSRRVVFLPPGECLTLPGHSCCRISHRRSSSGPRRQVPIFAYLSCPPYLLGGAAPTMCD